ncbi:MAG: His-Xaa-Ser system protein HxsD [Deltaproteobacteria bacterium]|nr:His-Xaa-Ser system protein HxsD [Deltaproteobacteria bacterium]
MAGEYELVDGAIPLTIDLRAYRLGAIKKAGYRLAERCTLVIARVEGECLFGSLAFRPTVDAAAAREVARQFFQELLDQELREELAEETSSMRALILAHAFSKTDLIRR